MNLPRDLIVTALEAVAPADVDVIPYARTIDGLARSTAVVRVDRVTPARDIAQGHRTYQCAVLAIVPTTDPGPADDELDALLEDVLEAIDKSPLLDWTEAQRAVLDETWPAYDITVTITTNANKE